MISEREKDILFFISEFIDRNSFPPSQDEIRKACFISCNSTVIYHLRRLRAKGFITFKDKSPRTIVIKKLPLY